ncbi:MAG TPA: Gfo/Idh/MocA family oxidoreductase [Planctomycetota bacterium]|nr:Gfo/Idh/MocA family oxidoreductase [Planctomycetota bacterium]
MEKRFANPAAALQYVTAVPKQRGRSMHGVPFAKRRTVRFGFIGLGGRGTGQLREMLAVKGAQITAVSDPAEAARLRARDLVVAKGQPAPALEPDWRRLCERDDVDVVYISSPWDWHVPQAVRAMECGKHAAVEVPAATTLADCWRLVDTSEATRRHCVILENCCYGYNELLALNLIRKGLLGSITHGEAAYIHELRGLLLADGGEGLWRRIPHIKRNGNLYPTHGLGPVAWYMGIHRGDRFTRIVSMSSRSAALQAYRDAHFKPSDPKRRERYNCGDMNSSLIQTAAGCTILLQHDVVTPRPYSRLNLVQGTRGTFADFPARVYLDRRHKGGHVWEPVEKFKRYQHPLWKKHGEKALKLGGHGGMDFIMNLRLVEAFQKGQPPDMDAYDAAAWSAPGPLSEISVAFDGLALPFPDFTRGHWRR